MKKLALTSLVQTRPVSSTPAALAKQHTGDELVMVNIRITSAQRKATQQLALDLDMTVKDLMIAAIAEFKTNRGYR